MIINKGNGMGGDRAIPPLPAYEGKTTFTSAFIIYFKARIGL